MRQSDKKTLAFEYEFSLSDDQSIGVTVPEGVIQMAPTPISTQYKFIFSHNISLFLRSIHTYTNYSINNICYFYNICQKSEFGYTLHGQRHYFRVKKSISLY